MKCSVSGCMARRVLEDKMCVKKWMGKVCRAAVARRSRLCLDHGRIGPSLKLTVTGFIFVAVFEKRLARKRRFQISRISVFDGRLAQKRRFLIFELKFKCEKSKRLRQ